MFVEFDPVMYTVQENDGQVILIALVQGNSVIDNAVLIFTSSDNTTAQGKRGRY